MSTSHYALKYTSPTCRGVSSVEAKQDGDTDDSETTANYRSDCSWRCICSKAYSVGVWLTPALWCSGGAGEHREGSETSSREKSQTRWVWVKL